MPASDPRRYLLAEVRELTDRYKAGGPDAFPAFHELVSLLLSNTILQASSTVRLYTGDRPNTAILGGWRSPTDPLSLKDGRFLRFSMTVYIAPQTEANRLKVELASYQYQVTSDNESWIFRYDYLRYPPNLYPSAHLQIRGTFREYC